MAGRPDSPTPFGAGTQLRDSAGFTPASPRHGTPLHYRLRPGPARLVGIDYLAKEARTLLVNSGLLISRPGTTGRTLL